jgi:hypothetical protein
MKAEELDYVTQRVLRMLNEEAPNIKLSKAMNHCKDYQELRDTREIYEFIIMMLLIALGFDGNGYLRNKEVAKRLMTVDDKIWMAINQALKVHGGYSCSPFTSQDWADKVVKKFELNSHEVKNFKESQLSINFPEDYCTCSASSMLKPISDTEFECFDCGKKIRS